MPFETLVDHCFFVTDNGSNIKLALLSFNGIPCACHLLSTYKSCFAVVFT